MKAKKILAFLISAVMAVQSAPMYAAEDEAILDDQIIELISDVVEGDGIPTEEVFMDEEILPEEEGSLIGTELEMIEEEAPILYADAVVSGDFKYIVNEDGETATITGYAGTPSGDLVIPEEIDGYTITSIGSRAFYGCSGFTGSLTISDC